MDLKKGQDGSGYTDVAKGIDLRPTSVSSDDKEDQHLNSSTCHKVLVLRCIQLALKAGPHSNLRIR